MRRLYYRHRCKWKKIIGITLAGVGFLIIMNFIPVRLLLAMIGIALLIMGALILNIK